MRLSTTLLIAALSLGALSPALAQDPDWKIQDGDRSAKIVDRLLNILQRDPFNVYAYKQLQQRAPAVGGLKAIAERYAAKLAADPNHVPTLLLLARFHASNDLPALALDLLVQAEKIGVDDWQMFRLRSDLHADLGDAEAATADLELALTRARDRLDKTDILRRLATLARDANRPDQATAYYQRIVDLAPRDRFLRQELAQVFVEQQMFPEAIEQYEAAAKLAGGNVEERCRNLLEIGDLLAQQSRFTEAIAVYERILSTARRFDWLQREARAQLVDAYRASDDLDGLLARVNLALKRKPRDPWALSLKAELLTNKGLDAEAVAVYETYLKYHGADDPRAFDAYIQGLARLQRYDEITLAYQALIKRTRDPEARLTHVLALVERLRVRSSPPFEAYAQLLHYEPLFKDITHLERLSRAYLSLGRDSADAVSRAEALIERMIAADPDRLDSLLTLLNLELTRASPNDTGANQILSRVLSHPNFNDEILSRLVDLLEASRRDTLIDPTLDRAVSLRPDDMRVRFLSVTRRLTPPSLDEALRRWLQLLLMSDLEEHIQIASLRYVELLEQNHLIDAARDRLRTDLARDPTDWRRARAVAILDAASGDVIAALETIHSVSPFVPDGAPIEEQILSTSQARHPEQALLLLRRLARRKPALAWRYKLRAARVMIDLGRQGEALVLVEASLSDAPNNASTHQQASEVYRELGQLPDAERTLRRAIVLSPSDPHSLRLLAEVLREHAANTPDAARRQQRLDESFEVCLEAVRLSRSPTEASDLAQTFLSIAQDAGVHATHAQQALLALANELPRADISAALRAVGGSSAP